MNLDHFIESIIIKIAFIRFHIFIENSTLTRMFISIFFNANSFKFVFLFKFNFLYGEPLFYQCYS